MATLATLAAEDALECEAEVLGEHGVDDRVDGAVDVAEPEADLEDDLRSFVGNEGLQEVPREKRHPTEDEAANDDAHRLRRFHLSVLIPHPPAQASQQACRAARLARQTGAVQTSHA